MLDLKGKPPAPSWTSQLFSRFQPVKGGNRIRDHDLGWIERHRSHFNTLEKVININDSSNSASSSTLSAPVTTSLLSLKEPKSYKGGLADPDWNLSMTDEVDDITELNVYELVPPPPHIDVVPTHFRNKSDEDGHTARNRARLVAGGHLQIEGIDYINKFAIGARYGSLRIVI